MNEKGKPINGAGGIPGSPRRGRGGDSETDTNGNGVPDEPDPWAVVPPAQGVCEYDLLLECLYSGGLLPSGDYSISDEEWAAFTLALYMDVHRRAGDGFYTMELNPGKQNWPYAPFHNENYNHRAIYDTPFWNGNGTLTGNICFSNGQCHDRNDVNYIAQGMWSAAAHEGKVGGKFIANYWKQDQYGHGASPEVLHWVEVGVDLYNLYNFQPAP